MMNPIQDAIEDTKTDISNLMQQQVEALAALARVATMAAKNGSISGCGFQHMVDDINERNTRIAAKNESLSVLLWVARKAAAEASPECEECRRPISAQDIRDFQDGNNGQGIPACCSSCAEAC